MKKVAYNACYGGFGLSNKALELLNKLKGEDVNQYNIERDDEDLITVIEKLGKEANGNYANLQIEEIPDNAEYEISEYDGLEEVLPPRQSW